jgi:predicted deacylase
VTNPFRTPEKIMAQCSGVLVGVRGPSFVSMGDCVGVIAQKLEGELERI